MSFSLLPLADVLELALGAAPSRGLASALQRARVARSHDEAARAATLLVRALRADPSPGACRLLTLLAASLAEQQDGVPASRR